MNDQLLREVCHLLQQLLEETRANHEVLKSVLRELKHPEITGFTIEQSGDTTIMALQQPDPGATLQYTATPTPAGSALPQGIVPTWTSSDTTNVTITTDSTGLIATVVLSPAITVGESVTLTIEANLPDGTKPTGTITFEVGAAPATEPTGFSIAQTA